MSIQGKDHKRQSVGKLVNSWPPGKKAKVKVDCPTVRGLAYITQPNVTVNELHWQVGRGQPLSMQLLHESAQEPRNAYSFGIILNRHLSDW